jgi:DNA-directed RNA polymerase subunit M/transcription elongation factor TFIIS
MDPDQGTGAMPTPAALERCSRCGNPLRLWLLLNPPPDEEEPLRVYRCEACSHFEWESESGDRYR